MAGYGPGRAMDTKPFPLYAEQVEFKKRRIMETIVFTYDREQSIRNGQFTVRLTTALLTGGRLELAKRPKIFFVKDLESVAARVADRTAFRTALESEMAFRKNEGRFFSKDQEFTRLRVDSRHIPEFVLAAQKRRMLVCPDGSPAAFTLERDVTPEIVVEDGRIDVLLGRLRLSDADFVVKTMPVTAIRKNHIVQLRQGIPFSLVRDVPAGKNLAEDERSRLLIDLSKQPEKLRIRDTGVRRIKIVKNSLPRPVVALEGRLGRARLFFDYGKGNRVKDNDETALITDVKAHLEIHRNRAEEDRAKARLKACGFVPVPERDLNWRAPSESLETLVPNLEDKGIGVEVENRPVAGTVKVRWTVRSDERKIRVGGTVISGDLTLGADGLFQAYREGKRTLDRGDGSLGIIADDIWQTLASLDAAGRMVQGTLVFDRADAVRVRACLDAASDVDHDQDYGTLCRFTGKTRSIRDYPLPKNLKTVLRPYQAAGYNWLRSLRDLGFHGILADDMGLGKTVQVLALIQALEEEGQLNGPVLLVVPRTLIFNWELEIGKFTPDLPVLTFSGSARTRNPEFLEQHRIVLTSYGLLRTETPLLCSVRWDTVVLDESHAIKNPETLTARAARHIPAVCRLALTGTPVENTPSDLWSQFDFLMPGFLGPLSDFRETCDGSPESLALLRQRTEPFILRRLKSQVLAELPPKTEVTLYCDFAEDQKALYQKALLAARDEMESFEGSRAFHILRLILRLRQIACHPVLAMKESGGPFGSGKTDEVLHAAMEILSEGHKILVFSQFTRHLQLIERLFLREKIPTFYLDGRTRDRAAVVKAFQSHQGPCLFFISLKAGGTGLNLSQASYVFLLDPWWNPAVENQAIDRCHRLGQHQPVTVYRFITRGSIEEKVDELKTVKRDMESAVIGATDAQALPFDERTMKGLIASEG